MNKWSWLGVLMGVTAAILYVRHDAYNEGLAAGRLECSRGQTQQAADSLNQFIAGTQKLTAQANEASRQLAQQIAERAAADDESTREIRNALKKTATARVNCVFDADVMQQITAAQQRAAAAATNGFTGNAGRALSRTGAAGG